MPGSVKTALLLAVFLCGTASAQASVEPDPLFNSHEVLDVTLTAPIWTITRERSVAEEYPGTFQVGDKTWDVKVRARGRFRRQEDICDFPPLRLNFRKSETKDTLLHGVNKVKLVTHCQDRSKRYDQFVIREYLVYRILNVLNDDSFATRLLRVTYVDSDGKRSNMTHYGFIIEHRDRLARRLERPVVEIPGTEVSQLDPAYTNLTSLFHYLIGNTDFSPVAASPGEDCCHNHVLFGNEGQLYLSIPYDFDQSGFVDADHAGPNPRFKLRSVKQRLYRGRCANNELLPETIATFQSNREAILALINEVDGLPNRIRLQLAKYVDSFYRTIGNPKAVEKSLVRACLN